MANILVLDSDPIEGEARALVIEFERHSCATARSLQQALTLLRERSFDLVVTDSKLNDADSGRIVRSLKGTTPEVAVLVLSECGATATEADGLLPIPCSAKELFRAITQVLSKAPEGAPQMRRRPPAGVPPAKLPQRRSELKTRAGIDHR